MARNQAKVVMWPTFGTKGGTIREEMPEHGFEVTQVTRSISPSERAVIERTLPPQTGFYYEYKDKTYFRSKETDDVGLFVDYDIKRIVQPILTEPFFIVDVLNLRTIEQLTSMMHQIIKENLSQTYTESIDSVRSQVKMQISDYAYVANAALPYLIKQFPLLDADTEFARLFDGIKADTLATVEKRFEELVQRTVRPKIMNLEDAIRRTPPKVMKKYAVERPYVTTARRRNMVDNRIP